ncbi:MAG: hypothetical protein IJF83_07365 [Methanobrevibacter sp.]|nr:hypothetical protein [Methanobrevibacter sp.]
MISEEKLLEDLKNQPLDSVLEKYDISLSDLFRIQRNRKYHPGEYKYITRTKSKAYSIKKTINGENYYYGTYHDKKEAELVVDELKKCSWDINQLPSILERLNIQSKSERE